MTEQQFLQQVWRPYDTITTDTGIKGRVQNVCFPTRSVRIKMPDGLPEWFRCEQIVTHTSASGETTDLEIIMEQQQIIKNLEAQNARISEAKRNTEEKLHETRMKLEERMRTPATADLLKQLNVILNLVREKKARAEKLEDCMEQVNELIEKMK